MSIAIVTADDWVGVYKDGQLVFSGHSVSLREGLRCLGIEHRSWEQEPPEGCDYPQTLAELEADRP